MKKIKYLILTIIIIIIIIIVIMSMLLIKNNREEDEISDILKSEQEEYLNMENNPGYAIIGFAPEKVKYPNIYFSAEACVEKVIEYSGQNDAEAVYNILNIEYIEEKQITNSNIFEKTTLNTWSNYDIEEMYEITGQTYATFYIKISIENEYIFLNINWDTSNKAFDMRILNEDEYEYYICHTIEDDEVESKEKTIQLNEYNEIQYVTKSDQSIAMEYYKDFVDLELNNPEKAYGMIDEEYREERFRLI